MNARIVGNCLFVVALLGLLSGCNSTQPQTESPSDSMLPSKTATQTTMPTLKPEFTATFIASPTMTLIPTETPTEAPTATFTPSATPIPSSTPTITPTSTPAHNQPGLYSAGGCVNMKQRIGPYDYRPASIDFCVLSVEVTTDYSMIFNVSWTANFPKFVIATKKSDINNTNMYIRDDLGNRYNHISAGGAAAIEVDIEDGETVTGWFAFPPAKIGATEFAFHDADNDVFVGGMVLLNPIIINADLELNWYPYALTYKLASWETSTNDEGKNILTHTEFPNCQILENETSEIQGKYKNTITLGIVDYEIYGWYEFDKGWSVREYLAIAGIENLDSYAQPLFHVIIPFDNEIQCIYDASEVLGTLHSLEQ
jgi:hypothetical protein